MKKNYYNHVFFVFGKDANVFSCPIIPTTGKVLVKVRRFLKSIKLVTDMHIFKNDEFSIFNDRLRNLESITEDSIFDLASDVKGF